MSLKACLALSCFVSGEPGLTPLTLLAELTKPSHSCFFTSYIYPIRPKSILHLPYTFYSFQIYPIYPRSTLSILSILISNLDLTYQSYQSQIYPINPSHPVRHRYILSILSILDLPYASQIRPIHPRSILSILEIPDIYSPSYQSQIYPIRSRFILSIPELSYPSYQPQIYPIDPSHPIRLLQIFTMLTYRIRLQRRKYIINLIFHVLFHTCPFFANII